MSALVADSKLAAGYIVEAYSVLIEQLTHEEAPEGSWNTAGTLLQTVERLVEELRVYDKIYASEPRMAFLSLSEPRQKREGGTKSRRR